MTTFFAIFSALLVINALLLIFSSSMAVGFRNRGRKKAKKPMGLKIFPLKSADSELKEAV